MLGTVLSLALHFYLIFPRAPSFLKSPTLQYFLFCSTYHLLPYYIIYSCCLFLVCPSQGLLPCTVPQAPFTVHSEFCSENINVVTSWSCVMWRPWSFRKAGIFPPVLITAVSLCPEQCLTYSKLSVNICWMKWTLKRAHFIGEKTKAQWVINLPKAQRETKAAGCSQHACPQRVCKSACLKCLALSLLPHNCSKIY